MPPFLISLRLASRFSLLLLGAWIPVAFGQEESAEGLSQDTPTELVRIFFDDDGAEKSAVGELVAQRAGFGYLVLDECGVLTAIEPIDFIKMESTQQKLAPVTSKEMGERVLPRMPPGSKFVTSEHFVVCYNTSEAYARWNIDLFERLYKGFHRYWKSKGFELHKPRFPLVAMVFETKADYVRYASQEFKGSENTFGYYHQGTNRLASYDLTGIEGIIPPGMKVTKDLLVNQILSRPEAERTVATIVHEACHQIAFNSGLQKRLGSNPLWLSEGIATYFESPDLSSKGGWGGIGKINQHNYKNLGSYIPIRAADSLTLLLTDDNRLRNGDTMTNSYAEAWGLTHFLLQTKSKDMVKYLQLIHETDYGVQASAKDRLELFRSCFGDDLAKIDRDFVRHLQRLR
jgi:hypothetical protein